MTVEEKARWFDCAMKFGLEGSIHLVMKSKIDGEPKWSVYDSSTNKILNSNLEWEDEPPKTKRDSSFMVRARFSFQDALTMYQQYKMFAV